MFSEWMTLTFFTPLENAAEFEPKVVEAVAWWWELDMCAGATRPLQQCIGSLVEDVLFCGNALIKTFYCFLLHQKVAVKLLSKLRTCGTAVASKTWATTGGQHSSWTKVRWTVGQ